MMSTQVRECVAHKNTVHRLQLQEDGDFAHLIKVIDGGPGDCTAKENAWLAYIKVRALRKLDLNKEVLTLADSLLRHQWMFYSELYMATLTAYKGNALFYLGLFSEARAPMESARRHYRKKKNFDPVTMANLDHNLASVEMVLGDSLQAVCRLAYAETIIRLAGDTPHLRRLLQQIYLAQARLARFGVINTDRLCLLGEIRRRPANDDGQGRILLIILVVIFAVGALMLALAMR
ncbi:MAG: hypothetical protein ACE10K_03530 [Rhodothermales bacterium]